MKLLKLKCISLITLLIVTTLASAQVATYTNSIKIIKISPSKEVDLKKGSSVKISVTVDYNLESASKAFVELVIKDQSNKLLGSSRVVVKKGMAKIDLSKDIQIPDDAKTVVIYTPLNPIGEFDSGDVDSRSYQVK